MRLLHNISPFRPIRYDLRLIIPSLKYPKFLLLQTIHFEKNPEQENGEKLLRLHANAKNLEVLSVFGGKVSEKSPSDNSKVTPENHDVMTIRIDEGNESQQLHLLINANLNIDDMKGMYRSKYKNSKTGQDKVLWSTHFEPVAARDCFVCVDEPASRCCYNTSYLIANTKENVDVVGLNNAPLTETASKVSLENFFASEQVFAAGKEEATNEQIRHFIGQWIDEYNNSNTTATASAGEEQADKNNFRKLTFATQPKTSSYLIAMAIGELEFITHPNKYISPLTKREIPLRFYFAKGRDPELAKFPIDVFRHSLEYFENYFQVPYPLPKLDVFAPPDFAIGGEENFGLIFVTERVMIDPAKASTARKISLTDLNEHETSHLWFGDLVSISTWSGLWLKEGFASFFGVFACNDKNPSWGALSHLAEEMYGALKVDSHVATHPVEVPIHDTSLITQIFDSISYSKGLSIVNMLYHFLGAEGFRKALTAYITKYQWESTTTAQLWASLEETSGKPISKIMNSFTSLEGYPIVSASLLQRGDKMKLTQSRYAFTAPSSAVAAAAESPFWTIPVIVQTLVGRETKNVAVNFGEKDVIVELPDGNANAVVMVNENHNGYYRVEYDAALFKRILINYQYLPEAFRTGLIDDTVALVSAGRSPANLLQLLDRIRLSETSPVVLLHAISIVPPVFKKFASAMNKKAFGKKLSLFEKCFGVFIDQTEKLGPKTIDKENSQISQLRPRCYGVIFEAYDILQNDADFVANSAITTKNSTIQKVTRLATAFLDSANNLAAEIINAPNNAKDVVFDSELILIQLRFAVRFGATPEQSERNFDGLWAVYCNDPDGLISRDIVLALPSTASAPRFEMIATETYGTNEKIRSQMGHMLTGSLVANPTLGSSNLWKIFVKNIESIDKKWGSGQFRIQAICEYISEATDENTDEYAKFFESYHLINAAMSIKRSIQQLQVCAELKRRVGEVEQCL